MTSSVLGPGAVVPPLAPASAPLSVTSSVLGPGAVMPPSPPRVAVSALASVASVSASVMGASVSASVGGTLMGAAGELATRPAEPISACLSTMEQTATAVRPTGPAMAGCPAISSAATHQVAPNAVGGEAPAAAMVSSAGPAAAAAGAAPAPLMPSPPVSATHGTDPPHDAELSAPGDTGELPCGLQFDELSKARDVKDPRGRGCKWSRDTKAGVVSRARWMRGAYQIVGAFVQDEDQQIYARIRLESQPDDGRIYCVKLTHLEPII